MKPKNPPKEIWLQIGEDCNEEDYSKLDGVTWCVDKINDNDIRYVIDKRQLRYLDRVIKEVKNELP